jgi:nitroreductase
MNLLEALQNRNSSTRLEEPAPDESTLGGWFEAAIRAPDHGRLRPWRFIVIRGESRNKLASLFVRSAEKLDPELTEAEKTKLLSAPLRAPLIVVVVASVTEHPKIPEVEQLLSAGCAAHNILLAAEATGFAGIWRTGAMAYNLDVMSGLGLEPNEKIVGFLYLGARSGAAKSLPALETGEYVSQW